MKTIYKCKKYPTVIEALEIDEKSAISSIKGLVIDSDIVSEIGKVFWFKKSAFKVVKNTK